MSATVEIVDRLKTIAKALPFGMNISMNAYDLTSNPTPFLENGFGVIIGEESRNDGGTSFGAMVAKNRSLQLIFCKRANCKDVGSDEAILLNKKSLFAKTLKEDRLFRSLVVSIEDNGDNGVSFFGGENEKDFIQVAANLTVIYKEVL